VTLKKEMMKRVAPPPPKPQMSRARVLSDSGLPLTGFRESLRHMAESQESFLLLSLINYLNFQNFPFFLF
jgi:hypothetical protein